MLVFSGLYFLEVFRGSVQFEKESGEWGYYIIVNTKKYIQLV